MSGRNRFPFTASQWQELEHQALIFKYMVSGMAIPPDLIFPIRRSFDSSKLFSSHHPHSQHIGWNCFQVGLGKKIDPEPGRCRRTDGKKWRCSKEAYPDSKYCERHMHRGKNRSRKPVEIHSSSSSTPQQQPNPNPTTPTSKNHSFSQQQQPFLYSHSRPSQDSSNNTNLLLYSAGSYSQSQSQSHSTSDYRRNGYGSYGLKDEVDHEHAFFTSEPSSDMTQRSFSTSSMEDPWQLTPLTMSSSSSKQRTCSGFQSDYSYLQLQSLQGHEQHSGSDQTKQDQHCYGDYKMGRDQEQPQKTVHRFFEEWPPKNRDSWLDLEDKSSNSASVSSTRLSISIPTSSLDFPIFNSRTHNDG